MYVIIILEEARVKFKEYVNSVAMIRNDDEVMSNYYNIPRSYSPMYHFKTK